MADPAETDTSLTISAVLSRRRQSKEKGLPTYCTFHDIDFKILDDKLLARHCPLDHGRHEITGVDQHVSDMGTLQRLPTETLFQILAERDRQSLFDCRRISRKFRDTVNGMREYQDLIKFAPNVLSGALSLGTARNLVCKNVHATLFERHCGQEAEPPHLAQHVSLTTGKRICTKQTCCYDAYLSIEEVLKRWPFGRDEVENLSNIHTLPGVYADNLNFSHRLMLVDGKALYIKAHSLCERSENHICLDEQAPTQIDEDLDKDLDKEELPTPATHCQRCMTATSRLLRFGIVESNWAHPLETDTPELFYAMTSVLVPFVDRRSRELEWGRFCCDCLEIRQFLSHDMPFLLNFTELFDSESFPRPLKGFGVGRCRVHKSSQDFSYDFDEESD